MTTTINASTSAGLISSADTSGILQLQTVNTAAITINASQNVGVGTASPNLNTSGKVLQVSSASSGTAALSRYTTGDTGFAATDGLDVGMWSDGDAFFWLREATNIRFATNSTERMRLDSAGNLGLGVTPSAWGSLWKVMQVGNGAAIFGQNNSYDVVHVAGNTYYDSSNIARYIASTSAQRYRGNGGAHEWYTAPSGTAGNAISFTQAATLDASGNYLLGATSQVSNERLSVVTGNTTGMVVKTTGGATYVPIYSWNATTTGDGYFAGFFTEASATFRGSITYNRAAGLVSYNTTSDYRAKDISGPVTGSGALIDSTPVYMGKMKGATQERPMFIAHETPDYAHTGVKDAVDSDGNPVYQQMDASALIPVMWAEIQSLRQRVATLEAQ